MGLIKAGLSAVGGVLADQWVDFITCDSMLENVLMVQGKKSQQGQNTKGSDNVISNGSKINVADNQCMIIVENGRIVDYCAETGQYTYNNQIQPSLLGGGLKDLGATFSQIGKRFAAGGATTDQQRVYYVNTKAIINNKIGWGKIPFRHYDPEFDKSIVVQVQGFGIYTFKIADPLMFYKNVAGNITGVYTKESLLTTMKSEVMAAINPALGKIATQKIPYDQLILYPEELGRYVDEAVGPRWGTERGIEIKSFSVESITVDDESAKKIAQLQETAIFTDAGMLGSRLGTAQANAMENAAKNSGGAMTGFLGLNMAQQAGGMNANDLLTMSAQQKKEKEAEKITAATSADSGSWTCSCGNTNRGKFCDECGNKKPEDGWTCSCGAVNKGKFCSECGKQKTGGAVCAKCGWKSEGDAAPKFCPECGEKF